MNGSAFPGVTSPQDGGGPSLYFRLSDRDRREAVIPDSYVSSAGEKLRLYRELDSITDEERHSRFESQLTDRFGDIPTADARAVRHREAQVDLYPARIREGDR